MQNAKIRGESHEFIVRKAKLLASGMLIVKVIIDQERFVEQYAARLQCINNVGKERASQIKEHEYDIVRLVPEIRRMRRRRFQIDYLCCNPHKLSPLND